MKLSPELRNYLAGKYDVDENLDIDTDGEAVLVTGTMPNTNQYGQFYAGDLADLQWEMDREKI